ncbi:MAG: hypothetical protein ROW39_10575 [Anaerolineaceae bacterium]
MFYPSASQDFAPVVQAAYQGMEMQAAMRSQSSAALDRLLAMGFAQDIDQIHRLYREELVRQTGLAEEAVRNSLEWEYHLTDKSWLAIARDRATGRYWMPVITDASCGGGTGRKIDPSMATTLNRPECAGDFFDLELLESAGGLGNTRQVILKDGGSSWFVFGEASAATQETLTWYDMKKPRGESWTPVHTFRPGGAAPFVRVVFQGGEWVALKADGSTGWRFNPERQEWVDTAPKNFVELIELKVSEYLQHTGHASLAEAMAEHNEKLNAWGLGGYSPPVVYGGFAKKDGVEVDNYWTINTEWLNLGTDRISVENIPGSKKGDFAVVMVGVRPSSEGDLTPVPMPFIVGLKWQGQWAHANNVWDVDYENDVSKDAVGVGAPEGVESWINKHYGKRMVIMAYLRFREEGDWNKIHFKEEAYYGLYKDASPVIKSFMNASNNYIKRWTKEPTLLGQPYYSPSGKGGGEMPSLERIYELLDVNEDYGLFVDRIFQARDN